MEQYESLPIRQAEVYTHTWLLCVNPIPQLLLSPLTIPVTQHIGLQINYSLLYYRFCYRPAEMEHGDQTGSSEHNSQSV